MRSRWGQTVVIALALVMVTAGCKSWPFRKRAPEGPGGTAPVVDPLLSGEDIGMSDMRLEGEEVAVRFDPVYFAYDSAQIQPEERTKIEKVADYLRGNPRLRLIVEGHCDERGSAEYNLALGERRALAIRAYLIGLGIAADRVQTVSYGEERPAAAGTGEAVWRLNRRGEFVIVQ